jgi:hypothetical protein
MQVRKFVTFVVVFLFLICKTKFSGMANKQTNKQNNKKDLNMISPVQLFIGIQDLLHSTFHKYFLGFLLLSCHFGHREAKIA